MDSHNNFAFMPDELSGFDDLIHNAGWPTESAQQQQQQQQQQFSYGEPSQDPYSRYTNNQPAATHSHYGLNHPQPYSSAASYSNSPYASQYQHARSADVFGSTSFSIDPSLQASTFHRHESPYSFPLQTENATIAPQSLQYSMNQAQPNQGLGATAGVFRSGGIETNFHHPEEDAPTDFFQNNIQSNHVLSNHNGNISYPLLSNENQERDTKSYSKRQDIDSALNPQLLSAPALPKPQQQQQQLVATPSRNPLRTTHPELLNGSEAPSQIRLQHAPFLAFEDSPIQVTIGSKNTIPKYRARNSRSGKDIIPGYGLSALASFSTSKTSSKRGRPPKVPKPSEAQYTGTSQASRVLAIKFNKLHTDDQLINSKSSPVPAETSSSEEESDSSEGSEYEEDEMPVMDLRSIRGDNRPTTVPEAARYDAIGIVWRETASNHGADDVKDAIEKFAAFFMAQRMQIKAAAIKMDSVGKESAEYKKYDFARAELLASLYEIINGALEFGHSRIVQNLGGHHKLVNGLTGTLIDCNKAGDMKGQLPRAVFKLLAKFQTMSDELLQKLKFDKLRTRWEKLGDEEINKDIETILANTTDAKQRAVEVKQDGEQAPKEKRLKEKVDQVKPRIFESNSSQIAKPAKRPHEGDDSDAKPNKKIANEASGANPPVSKPPLAKRIGSNLLGISSKPAARPTPRKRDASPPQVSKLGAILASIEKPREEPKVVEAPLRPPETTQEKARRERKESRRHLRVKFKEGSELEEIRLFKHERAEDEGRQDEMLKDAHDDRLEGMMHKKQSQASKFKKESPQNDDEDDYEPSEAEIPYQVTPIKINSQATRYGDNYITRGGTQTFTTAEQEIQRKREGEELMVVYTTSTDIPATPKELMSANSSEMEGLDDYEPELLVKTPDEPWLAKRLQEIQQYGPAVARHIFTSNQSACLSSALNPSNISAPLPQSGAPFLQAHQLSVPPSKAEYPLMDPAQFANIQMIVNSLKGKSYPPTEPPDWMIDLVKRDEWRAGYLRDNPIKAQADVQGLPPMQASTTQPSHFLPHSLAQQPHAPPPPQLNLQPPFQQPAVPGDSQMLNANHQAYLAGDNRASQIDYGSWTDNVANSSNDPNSYANQVLPRWEASWSAENPKGGRPYEKKQRGGHSQKQGGTNHAAAFDERGEYKGKKKPCRFYQEGKCAKGAACTYLHNDGPYQ